MKYQLLPRKYTCPVCHGASARTLWEVGSAEAAQHFVLQEKLPGRFSELAEHIKNLWGQDTCEVVRCEQCGFCYSHPFVAGDSRFYELAFDGGGYPSWKWEFQRTYDAISQLSRQPVELLEIGAGDGAFIRRITPAMLPGSAITCTEYSRYGRQQIEALGVKCYAVDVRELSDPELEEKFDVVCMFQVLEHMDRLDLLFEKLNCLMKRGASLFIAVPGATQIEFDELHESLLDMPPNHIGRWNENCFEAIGQQYGFLKHAYEVESGRFGAAARQFAVYRYLRRAQRHDSLENRIERIRNPRAYSGLRKIGAILNLMEAIPTLAGMGPALGNSQWVHLVKQ